MRVALISCWFSHQIYSDYAQDLRLALEGRLNEEVEVVTGDCICASRQNSHFANLLNTRCKASQLPYLPNPKGDFTRIGTVPRKFWRDWRMGRSYLELASGADILHFQEVTNSFGTIPAMSFLAAPSDKGRIVTVHELERFTERLKSLYKIYNRADAILVHTKLLKDALAELGVDERRIHVVPHGAKVAGMIPDDREGIVYYGGHHLFSGKGFDDFLGALQILNQRGEQTPVSIFGYFQPGDLEAGKEAARQFGLEDQVAWYVHPSKEVYQSLYAQSALTVIPFAGGSAAFPAAQALAHGTPTVATRRVELPEYLGTTALFVEPHSPVQIAQAISQFLENEALRWKHSQELLERARVTCDWSVVAERTLRIYRGEEAFIDPDPWRVAEETLTLGG